MTKLTRARNFEKAHLADIKKAERPVYHVSPAIGWMNDPNGFSYYDGKYHLFYQYYPYATKWGTMHWGHYVTSDFIHWDFMPAALAPDEPYESGCYSGSAVETEDGKHLIMYTAHLETGAETEKKQIQETQCIAVGDGADYIKYEGNPVLTGKDIPEGGSTADFRDPKIWIERGISGRVIDLELYIKAENSDCSEFDIYMDADDEVFTLFHCDLSEEVITVDRSQSGIKHDIVTQRRFKFRKQNGNLKLRFLVDRFSIELFVNDGEQVFTMCTYDTPLSADRIRFSSSHPVKIDIEKYDIIV